MPLNRKKKRVALINLEEERARRRASLVDRFLRGVTQFLDALARSPSAQFPLERSPRATATVLLL